jgi:hypothetical protein
LTYENRDLIGEFRIAIHREEISKFQKAEMGNQLWPMGNVEAHKNKLRIATSIKVTSVLVKAVVGN